MKQKVLASGDGFAKKTIGMDNKKHQRQMFFQPVRSADWPLSKKARDSLRKTLETTMEPYVHANQLPRRQDNVIPYSQESI